MPDDADPWCSALHALITRTFGDDCKSHGEPEWWTDNDREFVEGEERRRGLRSGVLEPFVSLPYLSDVSITAYTTGKTAKVCGHLFGCGEKLGDWEAFTLFYVQPNGGEPRRSLQVGSEVHVGEYPFVEDAVVARILRGTKPAGSAADARMQQCYYVLLKADDGFKYAALQHVHELLGC